MSSESTQLIESIKLRLVEELRPKRIILFGSHAAGTAGPSSDIDLLIEVETSDSYPERVRKVSSLFRPRDWSLDAFVFTPEEIAVERNQNGTLINLVEREGRILYER